MMWTTRPTQRTQHCTAVVGCIAAIVFLGAATMPADDNTTTTFSNGGSTNLGGALTIGSTGTNNTLLISNGTIVSNTVGTIGDASTANFNSGLVTGNGSVWHNIGPGPGSVNFFIGNAGSSNSLVVSAGGTVNNAGLHTVIGNGSASIGNDVTVTGSGSVWTNMATITVGSSGLSNRLTVSNGGKVDVNININMGDFGSAAGNTLVVDGANSLVRIQNALLVGASGARDGRLTVQNGGKLLSRTASVGGPSVSSGNLVIVTGSGSSWTNDDQEISIGTSGFNNAVIVSNGATVYSVANGTGYNYIGRNASASNNYMIVTGPGSAFVNRFGMIVGNDGSSNALFIANGGTVQMVNPTVSIDYGLIIGANSSSANNLVKIDGGNLIATNATASLANVDVRRGKLEFNSGNIVTERLYATNGASSVVQFNGGTLVTEGTTVANGSAFVVGNGSSAATLRLKGGTHSFADGLTINTAARLEGNGTVQGNTSVDGKLAPGESPGQVFIVGNLSLSSTATYEVELNGTTPGTLYDQTDVTGGVSLGNSTLSLSLGYSANSGDQFTIINNDLADAVSGTFNGLAEGSSVFVGTINEFSISYTGGDGNDVVLTFLVPEPNAAALLLAGAVLLGRRRSA
jgi:fibronectin-binding autotransporter adhesin